MEKDKLIEKMLTEKAEKNNTIDLYTYGHGLIDMYDFLIIFKDTIDTLIKDICGEKSNIETIKFNGFRFKSHGGAWEVYYKNNLPMDEFENFHDLYDFLCNEGRD